VVNVNSAHEFEAVPFLKIAGFAQGSVFTTYRTPIEEWAQLTFPLRERLIARGKIPANARFVPLREAPPDQLVQMYDRNLGGHPLALREQLSHLLKREEDTRLSLAILIDGQVQGLSLATQVGRLAKLEAKIIGESLRGSWANVMLMARSVDLGLEYGIEQIEWQCRDDNHDTIRMGARSHAVVVRQETRYERAIDSSHSHTCTQ
jgi:hypothetical protein